MPACATRYAGRPPISSPRKRTEPALGLSAPAIRLKVVLLPEPFGPIRPRISPSATSKETFLTARKPSKSFVSPSTLSTYWLLESDQITVGIAGHELSCTPMRSLRRKKRSARTAELAIAPIDIVDTQMHRGTRAINAMRLRFIVRRVWLGNDDGHGARTEHRTARLPISAP